MAGLTLGGGVLLTTGIGIEFGGMSQSGGTNHVSGGMALGGREASYILSGGLLTDDTTAILIGGYPFSPGYEHADFTQLAALI